MLDIAIAIRALDGRAIHPLGNSEDGSVGTADDAETAQDVIGDLLPAGVGDRFDVEEWLKISP